jgi:hypothetical protein
LRRRGSRCRRVGAGDQGGQDSLFAVRAPKQQASHDCRYQRATRQPGDLAQATEGALAGAVVPVPGPPTDAATGTTTIAFQLSRRDVTNHEIAEPLDGLLAAVAHGDERDGRTGFGHDAQYEPKPASLSIGPVLRNRTVAPPIARPGRGRSIAPLPVRSIGGESLVLFRAFADPARYDPDLG